MVKKIAVVTGASSGFGLLITLQLAKSGYEVIATMRDLTKGEKLIKESELHRCKNLIKMYPLDVTKDESIQSFLQFITDIGRVDVLVNNAGFAGAGFVEEVSISEYQSQFETNFFGVIRVTQVCLPIMRKQGNGKIINVSSISGRIGFPGMSPYVASKHALEGWSESLRMEMKPFGVDVCIIEPGSYKTSIWSTGKQVSEKSLNENSPYYTYLQKIEGYIKNGEDQFGDPIDVANMIVQITKEDKPDFRYPIGRGVKLSIRIKTLVPWKMWEKLMLKRLFEK